MIKDESRKKNFGVISGRVSNCGTDDENDFSDTSTDDIVEALNILLAELNQRGKTVYDRYADKRILRGFYMDKNNIFYLSSTNKEQTEDYLKPV